MSSRLVAIALLVESVAAASVVRDVRAAIARNDFALAEAHVAKYRSANGVTGEMIEALSWLGRGTIWRYVSAAG